MAESVMFPVSTMDGDGLDQGICSVSSKHLRVRYKHRQVLSVSKSGPKKEQ